LSRCIMRRPSQHRPSRTPRQMLEGRAYLGCYSWRPARAMSRKFCG
jgi:hypothetical protein